MLHAYEAGHPAPFEDQHGQDAINWREDQQARNLGAVVAGLSASARILCWCGGGHLLRRPYEVEWNEGEPRVWIPMGSLVAGYGGVEPFAIDQNITVAFGGYERPWLEPYAARCGSAAARPASWRPTCPPRSPRWQDVRAADAYVLSLDNALVA